MFQDDPKFRRFSRLQGHLEKLSSNRIFGYRPKFWRVLDNGTKVGYSNDALEPIKAQNIFLIKDCLASESSGSRSFELQTKDRLFILKAPNEEEMIDWIKGLTFLKKVANNQVKLKKHTIPTQTTMVSKSERSLKRHKKSIKPTEQSQKQRVHQPEDLMLDRNVEIDVIGELKKYLPEKCLKYYVLLTTLKVRIQGVFTDSFNSSTYILVSPKSLYPDAYIGDDNLSNLSLPPWLQINYFYRVQDQSAKEKCKQIFHVSKMIEMSTGTDQLSIKINTGQVIFEFFTDTFEQRECLKSCLEIAGVNCHEVVINNKISKKNYDRLFHLHENKLPQFESEVKKIIQSFQNPTENRFQPATLFAFLQASMLWLKDFIIIGEHKKANFNHVIVDVLKHFHEQVKVVTKLTWDSSFFQIKGSEILNMLRKLSEYYDIVREYVKSAEFLEGMKELSKIYVRMSWTNFEGIIINLVDQQRNDNYIKDDDVDYIQTHGITDLFKFIYNVFDLAYPHWRNKMHLHNVNKLMQKALQVFVNQIRSMIDEEVLSDNQMIALANNYFFFNDYVRDFYENKFQELAEKTQESYNTIVNSYREVSMIILDKIAVTIGLEVEQYCWKCSIQTIKCQTILQILTKSLTPLEKLVHMAFQKKINEKVTKQVHMKICSLVVQQVGQKKKLKLKQIIRCVKDIRVGLNTVFEEVSKSSMGINKKMEELEKILSNDLYSDIQNIIASSTEPTKGVYLKIMQLREDFSEGSALYRIVNEQSIPENSQSKRVTKHRVSVDLVREKNMTLSKQYFQEEFMDSEEGEEKSQSQSKTGKGGKTTTNSKLISEGFLSKGKKNQLSWEKSYFRLKNGFLYIFESEQSDRCRNAIEIKNISKIEIQNQEKPSFLLAYDNLGKQKEIQLKAENIEMRERWVNSLELERKRMLNEEQVKKKTIKYLETQTKKKKQMIIDYQELEKGKDYFSYS